MKLRTLLIAVLVALAAQVAHADECVEDVMRRVRPALLAAVREKYKKHAEEDEFRRVLITARTFLTDLPASCTDTIIDLQGNSANFHAALFADMMIKLKEAKEKRGIPLNTKGR